MAGVEERLQAALDAKEFGEVARILDQAELESSDPDVLAGDWPVALHILGHIYNGDLEDARFVWKRLPPQQQAAPEADAAWRLLRFAWARNYVAAWQALQAHAWSAGVQPLVDALVEATRRRMVALVAAAYSQVSPARAAELLGVSEAEARQLARDVGWAESEAGDMLRPAAAPGGGEELDSRAALERLTQYMVHLES